MTSADNGYVVVSRSDPQTFNFWSEVVPFTISAESVGDKIDGIDNGFGGIAFDGTNLYVGDRSESAPGIVVVDPNTNSVIDGPYDVGLPPSAIAVMTITR
jgi:hypothetical protein